MAAAVGCDAEPIHIPGSIQPHGVLVALDTLSFEVRAVSVNWPDYFGTAVAEVLGRPLPADLALALAPAVNAAQSTVGEPLIAALGERRFDVLAHRHHDTAIIELEPHRESALVGDLILRQTLAKLQHAKSAAELSAVAVTAVRALTGFDRVMLYRFDEEGHGDVVEECVGEECMSYRGLHFPAADIPRQARELYLLNWLRLIPDAAYVPVPLVGTRGPLDLSFASLRSVSPIHLEYLRNMGVSASMSISLVEGATLRGLIACHHERPHHISLATRAACEIIGRVVSLLLTTHEELARRNARETLRGTGSRLVDAMRNGTGALAVSLAERGDVLLQLVSATGVAVCSADEIRTFGVVPAERELAALVAWLKQSSSGGLQHTDFLSTLHLPAAEYAGVASGLLATTLPGAAYVMWFRPELLRTVNWAGDPNKAEPTPGTQLRPRNSFAVWTEIVRSHSERWRPEELDAVEDLRRHAVEISVTREVLRAEAAVRQRDEMIAVLSHDLKGPLSVVQIIATLLAPHVENNDKAKGLVARIDRAVSRMDTLVRDLLDLAKIESGRFDVMRVPLSARMLVEEAAAMLTPLAEAKGVRLVWDQVADSCVDADADRVFQVFANVVGNAIKFTPSGGSVFIDVTQTASASQFAVRDTGPGIDPMVLDHVFDRYWQAKRGVAAGSGLGLYIAKGIIEAHGETIWATSALGEGATFTFKLPACV